MIIPNDLPSLLFFSFSLIALLINPGTSVIFGL